MADSVQEIYTETSTLTLIPNPNDLTLTLMLILCQDAQSLRDFVFACIFSIEILLRLFANARIHRPLHFLHSGRSWVRSKTNTTWGGVWGMHHIPIQELGAFQAMLTNMCDVAFCSTKPGILTPVPLTLVPPLLPQTYTHV